MPFCGICVQFLCFYISAEASFLKPLFCFCRYPKLAAKHRESNAAGIDIFSKFSAFIKNTKQQDNASKFVGGEDTLPVHPHPLWEHSAGERVKGCLTGSLIRSVADRGRLKT